MTIDATITLEELDRALAAATVDLDADEQRLAVGVFRLLATGSPVTADEAGAAIGMSAQRAAEIIHSWPAVFFDEEDRIIGLWGLALPEMPHRLRVDGVQLYAWCAWDPLFLAMILGETDVSTDDPITGEALSYRVGPDGSLTALSHPESVLSFLRPDQPWDDNVMATFCHFVLQFGGPQSARPWTEQHPGTFVFSLSDGVELARRHVVRTFGDAAR